MEEEEKKEKQADVEVKDNQEESVEEEELEHKEADGEEEESEENSEECDEDEGDEEEGLGIDGKWEVEKIKAHRMKIRSGEDIMEYKITWAEGPNGEKWPPEWVSASSLADSPQLLSTYW